MFLQRDVNMKLSFRPKHKTELMEWLSVVMQLDQSTIDSYK